MKRIILSLLFATAAFGQISVQKKQDGSNQISNGPVVVGSNNSITATGTGIIAATAIPSISIITAAPLTGGAALTGNLTLAIPQSSGSVNGYLSSGDWTIFNTKQPAGNYMTALTGDGSAAGPGSAVFTLTTVLGSPGGVGTATDAPVVTFDAKGRATATSTVTITPALGSITGLGTGVAAFLAAPSSANLATAITDETGTGALVFGTSPTLVTPHFGSIVNTGTLTLPTLTDTLIGRATTDVLTNKSISGSTNTLTNIPNSALTNQGITLGTTVVNLGGTITSLAGINSITAASATDLVLNASNNGGVSVGKNLAIGPGGGFVSFPAPAAGVGMGDAFSIGVGYGNTVNITDNTWKEAAHFANVGYKTSATFTTGAVEGVEGEARIGASNTQNWTGYLTTGVGLVGSMSTLVSESGASGNISGIANFFTETQLNSGATTQNWYGFRSNNPRILSGTPLVNAYGVWVDAITAGSSLNYAVYTAGAAPSYFGGNVQSAGSFTGTYGSFASPGVVVGDSEYGVYVTGGNFLIKNSNNGSVIFRNAADSGNTWFVDGSGNGVLAGNLTVSGTGTSSFAGGIVFSPYNGQSGATYSIASTDTAVTFFHSGGTTVTLGTAVVGRTLILRTISADAVVSASSNVAPLAGGAAGTAILAATAGKWAILQGDGTNWQIIGGN